MIAMDVTPHETGVVRLFEIDLPDDEVQGFVEKRWHSGNGGGEGEVWPLREALGADHLDAEHVEVFPVGDVAALGLSTYLTEGLGMPEEEVARDRDRIESIRGHVLVVTSAAFGGEPQHLEPRPPLHPIGIYREKPARPVIGSIETESAQGRLARRSNHVVHAKSSPILTMGIIVVAMLLGAGIVLGLALGLG